MPDTRSTQVDDVALEAIVCSQLGAAYDECMHDIPRALDYQVEGLGFRVSGLGFRVWGFGFGVWISRAHSISRFRV